VDQKKFCLKKMSILFNIRNMSSFVRKLCRWGFSRLHPNDSNKDVFVHPDFVRGDRTRARKKVKCVGRLLAAGSLRGKNSGLGAMPLSAPAPVGGGFALGNSFLHRDADFVMQRRSMPGHSLPFHQGASLLPEANTGPVIVVDPSFDRVTDATATSAQMLCLSHRNQQQARMGQLYREQQELSDRELQNMLRQPEEAAGIGTTATTRSSYAHVCPVAKWPRLKF